MHAHASSRVVIFLGVVTRRPLAHRAVAAEVGLRRGDYFAWIIRQEQATSE